MIPVGLEAHLRERVAAWNGAEITGPQSAANFATLANDEGLDFATALLHDRLLRIESNANFLRRAEAAGNEARIDVDLIGIVPGAFYKEHPHTGADGARILRIVRALGSRAEIIPVGSLGTLAENARVIRDWLVARSGQRVALLSLSKGSADVKHALSLSDSVEAFANVTAWVSLSGMVQGTPLIDWLRRRPLRWWGVRSILWWHGLSARALMELRHGSDAILASWPVIPEHMRLVQVYGFPLAQHLSHRWAPRGYARLAPLGPNDGGGVLLADLVNLPGIVCPIWGADHYLMPTWDVDSLLRGIVTAAVATGELRHASQSAAPPIAPPASRSNA